MCRFMRFWKAYAWTVSSKLEVRILGRKKKELRFRDGVPFERGSIRWMMLVYDSVVFSACWVAWVLLHPVTEKAPDNTVACLYFLVGYALFFGLRLVLKSYKRILRYGSIHAFTRELLACVLSMGLFALLSLLLGWL